MKELGAEKEKENEAKRPPWRAVSVSTLPKPDKNALLRAKLLDASRRLRAGKSNIAVQTDFVSTKLMKEVCLGPQTDLIHYKDVGILTDGQLSKKKDGHNQYILTYSISQMTDITPTATAHTQTLLPRIFKENCKKSRVLDVVDSGGTTLNSDVKQRVAAQIANMRKFYFNEEKESSTFSGARAYNSILKPTLASWHFDEDVIEMEAEKHFIPYTIEPYKPWRSFIPLPFCLRGKSLIGKQFIDWYALLQSIDDLITESNNLVDKLDQIIEENSLRSIVDTSQNMFKEDTAKYVMPSEYWLPIIHHQEQQLKILQNNLIGNVNHKNGI